MLRATPALRDAALIPVIALSVRDAVTGSFVRLRMDCDFPSIPYNSQYRNFPIAYRFAGNQVRKFGADSQNTET